MLPSNPEAETSCQAFLICRSTLPHLLQGFGYTNTGHLAVFIASSGLCGWFCLQNFWVWEFLAVVLNVVFQFSQDQPQGLGV